MAFALNSNIGLNTLATQSALLGNSLNGVNTLNAGVLGTNSLLVNGGFNNQALAGLGFGLNGIGNFGFNNLGLVNTNTPLGFNILDSFKLCQRCVVQCPGGTTCTNGVCRASTLCGFIPNPNAVRVFRGSGHRYRSRSRKHH